VTVLLPLDILFPFGNQSDNLFAQKLGNPITPQAFRARFSSRPDFSTVLPTETVDRSPGDGGGTDAPLTASPAGPK
jgi:hypothetical protein